jgi:predicted HTH domain antitoxin
MTITIPHDILKRAGLTEQEALVEFACRLYDAEKISLPDASRLAGLERVYFEAELRKRGLPIFRPTLDEFEQDLRALRKLESMS